MANIPEQPSFLTLPLEIRRLIYKELLLSSPTIPVAKKVSQTLFNQDNTNSCTWALPERTLSFRSRVIADSRTCRTKYKVRANPFRVSSVEATYFCLNVPQAFSCDILALNRQTYLEAAPILYGSYTFDFDTQVEACSAFLSDLTPYSRSCIRKLGIIKPGLPYDKHNDRHEWSNMCSYIFSNLSLSHLSLGVATGMPPPFWNDNIIPLPGPYLQALVEDKRREELQWVRELIGIKGLLQLDVWSNPEHILPPVSEAMAFWVMFSACVEGTFKDYLARSMVKQVM